MHYAATGRRATMRSSIPGDSRMRHCLVLASTALFVVASALAQAPSPYAGDERREIKALSDEDVSAYLAGKGMGLARAAELNGYPGPMHVLDLAEPLALTAEQRARTQRLFESMRAEAIAAGRALVDEERALDALFRGRTADAEKLSATLTRIGQRQAEVRRVHLAAHLAQAEILTSEQVRRYATLRGYESSQPASPAGHGHGHRKH